MDLIFLFYYCQYNDSQTHLYGEYVDSVYTITLPNIDADFVADGGNSLKYYLCPDSNGKWAPRANCYRVYSGECSEGDKVTLSDPTNNQAGVTIKSFNLIAFANTNDDFIAISTINRYTDNIRAGILTATSANIGAFGVSATITGDWSITITYCAYITITASSTNSSRSVRTIKAIYLYR